MLNFFGLDTLEPEVWMDVNEEAGQQAEEAEEMDPAKQAAAKLMGLQASSMNSARQYLQDTRDPLQINDELYVQQLRLRESGPDQADAAKSTGAALLLLLMGTRVAKHQLGQLPPAPLHPARPPGHQLRRPAPGDRAAEAVVRPARRHAQDASQDKL